MLVPSLWAVDRQASNQLVALPHHTKLTWSDSGVGSITVEYPTSGKNFALLARDVAADSDLEVEIWLAGSRTNLLRGYLSQRQGDDVDERALVTFSGALIPIRLDQTIVIPQAGAPKQELRAVGVTPGALMLTLLSQAQSRGALTDITADFTALLDSSGTAWPETLTASWSPSKTTYLAVLNKLVDLGLVDSTITPAKVWRLWRFGGRGTNRSSTVTLRRGRNLTEATRRASAREAGTAVYADGAEGLYATADNATALARRGRRIEVSRSYGNLGNSAALLAATQKDASGIGAGPLERSFGVAMGPGLPDPWTDYGVADTVAVDTAGTLGAATVAQLQGTVDVSGVSVTVVCGDLIADRVAAMARRLNETQTGGVVVGTSVPDPASDTTTPNAPTGVLLSSQAYREGGLARASLRVSWTPPTLNTDGSLLADLSSYQVQIEYASQGGRWELVAEPLLGATDAYVTVSVATMLRARVIALDYSGHASAAAVSASHVTAQDGTAPPAPSTPVLSMRNGVVVVDYDGRGSAGEQMPSDTATVEVHDSASAGFTPHRPLRGDGSLDAAASTTFLGTVPWVGGQTVIVGWAYATTVYVRLVAVDEANNASAASAVASIAVGRAVADDITDAIIGAAKLASGAVTTPAIAPEAVTTAHLSVAALSDNLAINGSFEDPDPASPTQPAAGWALRGISGGTATLALDATPANVDAGANSAKIVLSAASGIARLDSPAIPVRGGDILLLQARVKTSRAVAGGLGLGFIMFAQDPDIPGTVGQLTSFSGYPTSASDFTLVEQQFTVPASLTLSTPTGPPRYFRAAVIPGGVAGDAAALTVYVDEVRVRKAVGTAEIQDLAVARAKIALLAVGDAQVETMSVGKLVAGTLSATVLMSGLIRTATSGARVEIDNAGLRLYDSGGTQNFTLAATTGAAFMRGTLESGSGSDRVIVQPSGAGASGVSASEISLYSAATRPAYINGISGTGGTVLGLNSGRSGDFSGALQTTLKLFPASWDLSVNTAPYPTAGSAGLLRGARFAGNDSQATLVVTNGSAVPRTRYVQSLDAFALEVRNSGDSDRDGGFLWLNRGTGTTYIGKKTTSRDLYLSFADPDITLQGSGTSRLLMQDSLVELRGTSSNRFIATSGVAQVIQSGSVKSFVIDHPQDDPGDPQRLLVHACLEGPQAGVIYRGTAVLEDHLAIVQLPPYFDALTTDDVQVFVQPVLSTTQGGLPMVSVAAASEVAGDSFHIVCPAPDGTRVAWAVLATRDGVVFDVEPRRDQVQVGGAGPYRYIVPTAEQEAAA